MRNNTAIQLFSYLSNDNLTSHVNYFTTLSIYSLADESNINFNTFNTILTNHISKFNIGNDLSINDAINIYTNNNANIIDSQVNMLCNVAHGFVPGTWGQIIELIQTILDDNTMSLDLNQISSLNDNQVVQAIL